MVGYNTILGFLMFLLGIFLLFNDNKLEGYGLILLGNIYLSEARIEKIIEEKFPSSLKLGGGNVAS